MEIGIVGLGQSGKSTLFEIMTGVKSRDVYSESTVRGVARVPDERFENLVRIFDPAKVSPAQVPFIDVMAEGDNWHVVEPREITVLDRIGGGDGFVGGVLYAILKGWDPEKWVQFGWASGALVTTLLTDYGQPADEEQIWSIWEGNARVRR